MAKKHSLKLDAKYYDLVALRIKTFEVRPNDRNYGVGDWLVMHEWTGTEYTGRWLVRCVEYILPLGELGMKGWVVMGID